MKKIFEYLRHNTHLFLLLYALIYIPWFCWLEEKVNINSNFHVIHMALDDYIPFCEFFVIPYYLWFIYMAAGIIFIAFTDGKLCWRLGIFLITGMTVFLFISTVYPNGQLLRPDTFARDNIFVHIVQRLYASDTPTNLFPSIHVYNSIAVNIAVWRSDAFKHTHAMRCGSAILMVSIILSTMFLKQHSVFDVVTGMITAAGMYMIVYVNNPFRLPVRQEKYEQKLHRI